MQRTSCGIRIREDVINDLRKRKEETGVNISFQIEKALLEKYSKGVRK